MEVLKELKKAWVQPESGIYLSKNWRQLKSYCDKNGIEISKEDIHKFIELQNTSDVSYHADLVNRNFRKFRGVIPSSHFAIRLSHFSVWLFPILTNSIPVKNSFRFGKEAEKTQKIPEKT